jgi:hypothetical protein
MSSYRRYVTCGARRRNRPDDPCCREAEHRGMHRGHYGPPWPNRQQPQAQEYVRYLPPHKRGEAAQKAELYAAYVDAESSTDVEVYAS